MGGSFVWGNWSPENRKDAYHAKTRRDTVATRMPGCAPGASRKGSETEQLKPHRGVAPPGRAPSKASHRIRHGHRKLVPWNKGPKGERAGLEVWVQFNFSEIQCSRLLRCRRGGRCFLVVWTEMRSNELQILKQPIHVLGSRGGLKGTLTSATLLGVTTNLWRRDR